jgi:hypothetical protein
VQRMTTNPRSVFLHLAAEAYRKTEVPEALEVANRIIAHAAVPAGQRPKPAIFSHLAEALAAKDAHPAIATLVDVIEDLPWIETSFGATERWSRNFGPVDKLWLVNDGPKRRWQNRSAIQLSSRPRLPLKRSAKN